MYIRSRQEGQRRAKREIECERDSATRPGRHREERHSFKGFQLTVTRVQSLSCRYPHAGDPHAHSGDAPRSVASPYTQHLAFVISPHPYAHIYPPEAARPTVLTLRNPAALPRRQCYQRGGRCSSPLAVS